MSTQEYKTLGHRDDSPTGLVLSGGGARGTFQVGVYEVLMQDPRGFDRIPDVVSGTSAGALNAALIAAELSPARMLEFWLDLAYNPPVKANGEIFSSLIRALQGLISMEPLRSRHRRARELRLLQRLLRKHRWFLPSGALALVIEFFMTARFDNLSYLLSRIDTPCLFDFSGLRDRLEQAIGAPELNTTRTRVAINVINARAGGVMRIVNYKPEKSSPRVSHYRYEPTISLDMVMASAAIPLLFNPVRVGGDELWDGGLLVNTPLAPAIALGAKRIVPVLVTVRNNSVCPLSTMGEAIERVADTFLENAYNIDRKLLLDRNMLARLLPDLELNHVDLFKPIRPHPDYIFDAGSYLYFARDAMMAMYEAGKRAARHWLDRGVELDSRDCE